MELWKSAADPFDRRFGTDSPVESAGPENAQCSKLFVCGQHRIWRPSGRKNIENRRRIALAIDSVPIRRELPYKTPL